MHFFPLPTYLSSQKMRLICNYVVLLFVSTSLGVLSAMWLNDTASTSAIVFGVVVAILLPCLNWCRFLTTGNRVTSLKKINSTTDFTNKEPDTLVRSCTVLFGHNQTEGLGEFLNAGYVPRFIRNAISAHHWCLVFRFDDLYRTLICELDIDAKGNIKGMYRPYVHKDELKYTEHLLQVTQLNISPQQIQQAAWQNSLNGQVYDVKSASCQHWVTELATALHFATEFNAILANENSEHTVVSGLIHLSKSKYSKWETAERGLIDQAQRKEEKKA